MVKESLMNNETHVDASQKSKFPLLWLFWEFLAPFKHSMGPKECSKGVHDVHRSCFYTIAILTSNSLYTGGQNSCGATEVNSIVMEQLYILLRCKIVCRKFLMFNVRHLQ